MLSILATPFSILSQGKTMLSTIPPTTGASNDGRAPMQVADVTNTGNGRPEKNTPESKVEKSGDPMGVESTKPDATSKPQADEADDASVRENKKNQVAIINATLTRIDGWFGSVLKTESKSGQVVLVLPKGLVLCKSCARVRVPESMRGNGHCEYCDPTLIEAEKQ